MKLSDLEYVPSFDLLAPQALYRVQRRRARAGSVKIGRLLLPPADLVSGRFDVKGVHVAYFGEKPETALFEALCRREATALSMKEIDMRTLLCVQTTRLLKLLDLRLHAQSWPVLQSLRFHHTQGLAREAYDQGFAGIVYRSAQQYGMDCYALFGESSRSLRTLWLEPLTEQGTGNLHISLAAALVGSQVTLAP